MESLEIEQGGAEDITAPKTLSPTASKQTTCQRSTGQEENIYAVNWIPKCFCLLLGLVGIVLIILTGGPARKFGIAATVIGLAYGCCVPVKPFESFR